jgi:hypothetical protein
VVVAFQGNVGIRTNGEIRPSIVFEIGEFVVASWKQALDLASAVAVETLTMAKCVQNVAIDKNL